MVQSSDPLDCAYAMWPWSWYCPARPQLVIRARASACVPETETADKSTALTPPPNVQIGPTPERFRPSKAEYLDRAGWVKERGRFACRSTSIRCWTASGTGPGQTGCAGIVDVCNSANPAWMTDRMAASSDVGKILRRMAPAFGVISATATKSPTTASNPAVRRTPGMPMERLMWREGFPSSQVRRPLAGESALSRHPKLGRRPPSVRLRGPSVRRPLDLDHRIPGAQLGWRVEFITCAVGDSAQNKF